MLVSIFCSRHKFLKCVECGCSKLSVAFSGAKSGESDARDAAGISRVYMCVCV